MGAHGVVWCAPSLLWCALCAGVRLMHFALVVSDCSTAVGHSLHVFLYSLEHTMGQDLYKAYSSFLFVCLLACLFGFDGRCSGSRAATRRCGWRGAPATRGHSP